MKMQLKHQMSMDDILGVLGASLATVRKVFTSMRSRVTRSVMRPGTMSGGMRKLIQLAMTKRPVGRYVAMTWEPSCLLSVILHPYADMLNPKYDFSLTGLSPSSTLYCSSLCSVLS